MIAMSASAPTWIAPLRGYKPMIFAGLVLSFVHISSSVRRPSSTPRVYVSGSSVSSPGIPIGIFVQSPCHIAFCSRVKVQVSVEITDTSPWCSPFQSRSTSAGFFSCGQQAKRWPSSRSNTVSSRTRYCTQVSAITGTPRACAARMMSAPSPVDMWTM